MKERIHRGRQSRRRLLAGLAERFWDWTHPEVETYTTKTGGRKDGYTYYYRVTAKNEVGTTKKTKKQSK